jgi:thiamine biosynthesis lipoprotein
MQAPRLFYETHVYPLVLKYLVRAQTMEFHSQMRAITAKSVATLAVVGSWLAHAEAALPSTGIADSKPGYAVQSFSHRAMWTEFKITFCSELGKTLNPDCQIIADEAFAAIDELESRVNNWDPETQLSRINAGAAEKPMLASQDIIELLTFSKHIHDETEGTFDVTVGPLLKLYGFYEKQGRQPTQEDIKKVLKCVGLQKVSVDEKAGTVKFAQSGMLIDFGGIAKGLAVDRAAQVLRKYGITRALVDGGTSSIVAIGAPPDSPGWTVQIRHPYDENASIGEVAIKDESMSTSGCYGNELKADGKPLCHTFDPRTGRPVEGMLAVAVVAKSGIETDALDNAFMVLGPAKIRSYCEAHRNIRTVIVPVPASGKPVAERVNFPKAQGS